MAQPNEMCNWDGGECWFYGSEGDDELDDGSEGDDEFDDGNFGLPKAWGLIGGAFGAVTEAPGAERRVLGSCYFVTRLPFV